MTRRVTRSVRAVIALFAGLIVATSAAACTNSEGAANREPYSGTTSAEPGEIQSVTLTVGDSFRFSPSTVIVHPGMVRVTLKHTDAGAPHNWQLVGYPAAQIPTIMDGQSASVLFTAPPPGKYTFICTIHERQGQTGTLIVLAS